MLQDEDQDEGQDENENQSLDRGEDENPFEYKEYGEDEKLEGWEAGHFQLCDLGGSLDVRPVEDAIDDMRFQRYLKALDRMSIKDKHEYLASLNFEDYHWT
jgi:hypothetical protein